MSVRSVLLHQLHLALASVLSNIQASANKPGESPVPEDALTSAHQALAAFGGYLDPPVRSINRAEPQHTLESQLTELRRGLGAILPWVTEQSYTAYWPRLCVESLLALPMIAIGLSSSDTDDGVPPPADPDVPTQLARVRTGLTELLAWAEGQGGSVRGSAEGKGASHPWCHDVIEAMLALPAVAAGRPVTELPQAAARFTLADIQALRPDWDEAEASAWLARHGKTIESRLVELGNEVVEQLLAGEPAPAG